MSNEKTDTIFLTFLFNKVVFLIFYAFLSYGIYNFNPHSSRIGGGLCQKTAAATSSKLEENNKNQIINNK